MIANRPAFSYPPRPEHKIKPDNISLYDNGEYYAQPKLNGSACVLMLHEGGDMLLYNRHGEKLTNADTRLIDVFSLYRGGGWMMLAGELLNKNKLGEDGQSFNQRFVIWDILMLDNLSLEGTTFIQRVEILEHLYFTEGASIVNGRGELESYEHLYCLGAENCYMVQTYNQNFKRLYEELVKTDIYEGVVIKRKNGLLMPGITEKSNGHWQIKCRKETRNYKF
jgi:hypothetical protein